MVSTRRVVRLVGWAQIVLSALLAASVVFMYVTYSTSIGRMLGNAATTLRTGADAISRVAETVRTQQETVDASIQALDAGRMLVGEIRSAGEVLTTQVLPPFVVNTQKAAKSMNDASGTFKALGAKIEFLVPTSIEMQGVKPIVVYTRPLRDQAAQMLIVGQNLQNLGKDLNDTSAVLDAQAKKMGAAVSDTSQKTVLLLDGLRGNMTRVKTLYLPGLTADLKAMETGLREMGDQLQNVEWLVRAVLIFALALAMLFACNGVFALVLVPRRDAQ